MSDRLLTMLNEALVTADLPVCSPASAKGYKIWLNRCPKADEVSCTTCGSTGRQYIVIVVGVSEKAIGGTYFVCRLCTVDGKNGSFAGWTHETKLLVVYTPYIDRDTPSPAKAMKASKSPAGTGSGSSSSPSESSTRPSNPGVLVAKNFMSEMQKVFADQAKHGDSSLRDAVDKFKPLISGVLAAAPKTSDAVPLRTLLTAVAAIPTSAHAPAASSGLPPAPGFVGSGAWKAAGPQRAIAALKAKKAAAALPVPGTRGLGASSATHSRAAGKRKVRVWRFIALDLKNHKTEYHVELYDQCETFVWGDMPAAFRQSALKDAVELLDQFGDGWLPFGVTDEFPLCLGGEDIIHARIVCFARHSTGHVINMCDTDSDDSDAGDHSKGSGGSLSTPSRSVSSVSGPSRKSGSSGVSVSSNGRRTRRTASAQSIPSPSSQINMLDFFEADAAVASKKRPRLGSIVAALQLLCGDTVPVKGKERRPTRRDNESGHKGGASALRRRRSHFQVSSLSPSELTVFLRLIKTSLPASGPGPAHPPPSPTRNCGRPIWRRTATWPERRVDRHPVLLTHHHLPHVTMADPSGAAPQPGPNDVSTAILRPKKSPNRVILDEATADNNSAACWLCGRG
ncbi:hypothetical protein EXIGLDRAFT_778507 [Exidia glandulosa HHB12029]|uniref:Uncharacterized protein n=1 Tax=Exidia glandulosa HHB12029 TaxID=1314781 RepID=A0A165CHV0_EXIGL|nr:hypothetical protein EXIGLDRAFT_778507 [Exidia glandulosa HHB12029]